MPKYAPFTKQQLRKSREELSQTLSRKIEYQKREILFQGKNDLEKRTLSLLEFEKRFHITYYSQLRFASPQLEKKIQKIFRKALTLNEVEQERIWLGAYYSPFLRRGFINQISIRYVSDQVGHGVFAEKNYKTREYVGEYTGLLMRHPLFNYAPNDFSFAYPAPTRFIERYSINSLHMGNEMRMINHSDNANCEAIGVVHDGILRIIIRTFKPIAKGEQLTYDYGNDYWRKRSRIDL